MGLSRIIVNIFSIEELVVNFGVKVMGTTAIWRNKERNVWMYAIATLGILIKLFLVLELIFSGPF